MTKIMSLVLAAALALAPVLADARGGGGHSGSSGHSHAGSHSAPHSSSSSYRAPSSGSHHRSSYASGAPRDGHGKIKRSPAAKAAFKKSHPCPSNGKTSGACPGYVIDHVQALKHGGADAPNNMQWQTKEAAKAKDKWE